MGIVTLSGPLSVRLVSNSSPFGQRDGLPHGLTLEHLDQAGGPSHLDVHRPFVAPQPECQPRAVGREEAGARMGRLHDDLAIGFGPHSRSDAVTVACRADQTDSNPAIATSLVVEEHGLATLTARLARDDQDIGESIVVIVAYRSACCEQFLETKPQWEVPKAAVASVQQQQPCVWRPVKARDREVAGVEDVLAAIVIEISHAERPTGRVLDVVERPFIADCLIGSFPGVFEWELYTKVTNSGRNSLDIFPRFGYYYAIKTRGC